MKFNCILLFICSLVVGLEGGNIPFPPNGLFSVFSPTNTTMEVASGQVENYSALAKIAVTNNETGWTTLDIVTNAALPDADQAYAAGYVEGALTSRLIYDSWMTQLASFYNGSFPNYVTAFLVKNDAWVRVQVEACSGLTRMTAEYEQEDCDYWYHVGLVTSQLDGLVAGYNDYCDPGTNLTFDVFLAIQANPEIDDLLIAANPDFAPHTARERMADDHCSALVKYSAETQQLFHGHTTWCPYTLLLRVFKHFTFHFSHPSAQAFTISFSSLPGFMVSGDDYYNTDQGLIVTETTNNIFNLTLYDDVTPAAVMYWYRVIVANRMATNGSEWTSVFSKYNSGTYNNQWQITDTKLFTPGQAPQPGTLTILEQLPGYIETADVTDLLISQGYFPSYNIPYFTTIYNMAGYGTLTGDEFSYTDCPRANIFRRDQGKVNSLETMKNMMRYNDYQNDPFSLGNPCNGIAARCDLNTTSPFAFGGTDSKISDNISIKNMTTAAISGPTTVNQPPFSWTGVYADNPHFGQPTTFNFAFNEMYPVFNL